MARWVSVSSATTRCSRSSESASRTSRRGWSKRVWGVSATSTFSKSASQGGTKRVYWPGFSGAMKSPLRKRRPRSCLRIRTRRNMAASFRGDGVGEYEGESGLEGGEGGQEVDNEL